MVLTKVPGTTARRTGSRAVGPLDVVAAAASRIQAWANCAKGRRRTEHALHSLERTGWQVRHNITLPAGGRVDHLVLGPRGVYVLDSRAWPGVVTVDQKGATVTPRGDPTAAWTAGGHHRALPPAAAAVVRTLSAAMGNVALAPRTLVVVWSPFPDRLAESGGITYIAGDDLVGWLSDQPRRLDDQELTALTASVLRVCPPRSIAPDRTAAAAPVVSARSGN